MSGEVLRLSLITHAMTDALHHARFPGNEPVNAMGLRDLARIAPQSAFSVRTGPELRTRQSASTIFSDATADPGLGDISYGEWVGRALTDLSDAEAASWLTDTAWAPPGGESIDDLLSRVAGWLAEVADAAGVSGSEGSEGSEESKRSARVTAVTHPAVVRAVVVSALGAPAQSFWRVDVPPLSRTSLHCRGGRWTLRSVSEKLV